MTLVFYDGEEVADEHNGLRRLFAESPELVQGDLAILLEPTGGWVEAGCQGTIHVRAIFDGVRAHSARPWMGTNAIHRAAPLLERCANFEAATVDVDSLEYREALQVVRIEGGIANNVVPDRCEVVVNRRYAPSRSLEDAVDEVVDVLHRCGRRPRRGAERVDGRAAEPHESADRGDDRRVRPAGAARSWAGPTWPASPRTGSRRATSDPVIRSSRTPRTSASSASASTRAWRCSRRSSAIA